MQETVPVLSPQPVKPQLHPCGDYYVIKPIDPENRTSKGLFLPSTDVGGKGNGASNLIGVVASAGPGLLNPRDPSGPRLPMQAKPGDLVHYTGAGTIGMVDEKGEPILFTRDAWLVCVITGVKPETIRSAGGGKVMLPNAEQSAVLAKIDPGEPVR